MKKIITKNIIFRNGIYGGLLVSMVMASMTLYMKFHPNYEPSMFVGFLSMFIGFSFVFVGIKSCKAINNNLFTFGNAFKTGFLIALIISTLYVGTWLIIYYNFFPHFMEQYATLALKHVKAEELAAKTADLNQMKEWYKNPLMVIVLTYLEILPAGILSSFVSAFILRKK
ncbi:DUF4199 domain-containing protein [Flavobacterium aciduliphilum]|uniref:Uncharacterized protein DUF4199 n=1 Tax=Flavobacterium aciduliphilum TaxID=1101402 RepID=A0A328YIR6_9FLAO|nr:DUF4199 domain-containing protein [Flavobacterium aciduliphilum]RAR70116.1 uncharacterized protein DUF4199 [Flavobacterium aciduliphilum]